MSELIRTIPTPRERGPANTSPRSSSLAESIERAPLRLGRTISRFRFFHGLNLVGAVLLGLFLVAAVLGDRIAPYDPNAQNIANAKLEAPSLQHLFGTDDVGRDILSRLIAGARVSLQVGLVVVALSLVLGTVIGSMAGFYGGLIDEFIMRVTDIFLAFPALLLAIVVSASLGNDLGYTMIAVAIVFWPWYARLTRAQVLSLKKREFVEAGRAIGCSTPRLLLRHIIPNAFPALMIQATLDLGYAILITSSLSFIGLGVQPPTPEWGEMLASSRAFFRDSWWHTAFPGLALALTILAFNLVGDGLRESLDPRARQR